MIDIQKIREVTNNPQILAFAEFVISETGNKDFPNYKELDLMKIPRLVGNVYVFDPQPSEDKKLLFKFSGTRIDEHNGTNVTGKYFEDFYIGDDFQTDVGNLYDVIEKRKIGFLRRMVIFENEILDKVRYVKRIAFPCSSNGTDINFIIGLIIFERKQDDKEDLVTII